MKTDPARAGWWLTLYPVPPDPQYEWAGPGVSGTRQGTRPRRVDLNESAQEGTLPWAPKSCSFEPDKLHCTSGSGNRVKV